MVSQLCEIVGCREVGMEVEKRVYGVQYLCEQHLREMIDAFSGEESALD